MTRPLLSERIQQLPYSGIREIFDLAGKMEDVIHFEIGEPDFDTPRNIIDAAFESARNGATHYTSSGGIVPLRNAIARRLTTTLGVSYEPEEIVVTSGGMEALLLSFIVTMDQGDELLLPAPHWPNYPAHAMLANARTVAVPLRIEDGYKPSIAALQQALTPNTRALLLNYPHNPTGATLDRNDLEPLAEFAIKNDLLVFSDEAYETLVFDDEFVSIASAPGMKERTIVLRTFSKSYAMTGWRVGYLAAPAPIAQKAAKLHEHTSACTSALSQMAALAALDTPDTVPQEMVASYRRRRDLLIHGLEAIPGLKPFTPRGTFYAFVDISALGKTAQEFALSLLRNAGVAVAPGTAFSEAGEGFIRICFANSDDNIREGLRRIEKAVQEMNAQSQSEAATP